MPNVRARPRADGSVPVSAASGAAPAVQAANPAIDLDKVEISFRLANGLKFDAVAATDPGTAARTMLNPHHFERTRRIDHVFARGARLQPRAARRVLDVPAGDGTWPSDHFGVLVEFRVQP